VANDRPAPFTPPTFHAQPEDTLSRTPSPRRTHIEREVDGQPVRAAFYGGFVSRLVYRRNGRDHELFSQETDGPDPFVLPDGQDAPDPVSLFEFWGPGNRRVAFEIHDDDRQIDYIEVKLKEPGASESARESAGGGVRAMQDNRETLIIYEAPVICPPACNPRPPLKP
jgi:hypothetical protein